MAPAIWTPIAESCLDDILFYIAFVDRRPATGERLYYEIQPGLCTLRKPPHARIQDILGRLTTPPCYNQASRLKPHSRKTTQMLKTIKLSDAGTKSISVPLGSEARHFGEGATSLVVNDGLTVHWNKNGKALGHRENLHAQKSFGQHLPKGVAFYGDVIAVIDDAATKPQPSAKKKGE